MSSPFPHSATTILVVDDERISRRVAYRILSEEGYRVLEADSSEEALDVFRIARGRVDLLMVDVVMPGIDGVALCAEQKGVARRYWGAFNAAPSQVLATKTAIRGGVAVRL